VTLIFFHSEILFFCGTFEASKSTTKQDVLEQNLEAAKIDPLNRSPVIFAARMTPSLTNPDLKHQKSKLSLGGGSFSVLYS